MERLVIGVDPGLRFTGVVSLLKVTTRIQEIRTCLIRRPPSAKLIQNIDHQIADFRFFLKSFGENDPESALIIETPRSYPKSPVRTNDLLDLSFMAGALTSTFLSENSESKVVSVYPRTWKGQIPKPTHNVRILSKIPDLSRVLESYPPSHRNHLIDAAGLALWGLEKKNA